MKTTIQQHCTKSRRAIRQPLLRAAGTVLSWLRIEESVLAYAHSGPARTSTSKVDLANAIFDGGAVTSHPPGSSRSAA